MMLRRSSLLRLIVIIATGATSHLVAAETQIRIRPGPAVISDAERAIEADPVSGVEHGVILIHETYLNDAFGTSVEKKVHMRAKILSNEARSLADVEIFLDDDESLTDWWGRTLLPDGTVLEVAWDDLEEQQILRYAGYQQRAMKAALPGVVPGAVIDYGYTLKGESRYRSQRIMLQQEWPVLRFRYRWKPYARISAAYLVHRAEGFDVHVERDTKSVLVVANNLPPVLEEPYMPPDHEVRASAILYYLSGATFKKFWQENSRRIESKTHVKDQEELVLDAIAAAKAEPNGDLQSELRAAYDWIAGNVENPLYADEDRAQQQSRKGSTLKSLNRLFVRVARGLGAEANVVMAPDRTKNFWDPEFRSMRQFASALVAVRAPGDDDDNAIIVDPSSGLSFAEIPWRVSGLDGLLADRKDVRSIFIPPSSAAKNVTQKSVHLAYNADASRLLAKWSEFAKGQAGMVSSQKLGSRNKSDRERYIEWMCGASSDTEIIEADSSVAHPPVTTQLSCKLERFLTGISDNVGSFHMAWGGPWIDPLPDLPPGPRVHPVIFEFPYVETMEIEVNAPPGFYSKSSPDEIGISEPYGRYQLTIIATDLGFKVQRSFAMLPLTIPPEEYEALRTFVEKVRQADKTRLLFVREE